MDLGKKVRKIIFPTLFPLVFVGGLFGGLNFYSHGNISYDTGKKKVFQKIDGLFGHTKIELYDDGRVEMERFSSTNFLFYTDYDGDKKVDRVFIGANPFKRKSYSEAFYRDKDYEKYPYIFRDADLDFKKQMIRFKPLIDKE